MAMVTHIVRENVLEQEFLNFLSKMVINHGEEFENCGKKFINHIVETYSLKCREYANGIYCLDYDQINSPSTHPIVMNCRGTIVRAVGNEFYVVSAKFVRFFNLGEHPEQVEDFDFNLATAFEKVDGSIIGLWYDVETKKWNISTRGTAYAEGNHPVYGNFRNAVLCTIFEGGDFSKAECEQHMNKLEELFQGMMQDAFSVDHGTRTTHIFELIGPYNQCVKKYEKAQMVYLGSTRIVSDSAGFIKEFYGDADVYLLNHSYPTQVHVTYDVFRDVEQYNIDKNPEAVTKFVNSLKDLDEGVVLLCHKTGKRIKVKSSTYVAAHRLRGDNTVPSRKHIAEVVVTGEVDELVAYFPDLKPMCDEVINYIKNQLDTLTEVWDNTKHIESQKDFALTVKSVKSNHLLFSSRSNNTDPRTEYHKLSVNKKLRFILE